MKVKKAGLLTKLVVLALLIGLAIMLLDLGKQTAERENQIDDLEAQRAAQIQVNADLQDDLEHSDDLESQMDIARDELGLVVPGEKVFPITE